MAIYLGLFELDIALNEAFDADKASPQLVEILLSFAQKIAYCYLPLELDLTFY
jgi:hypothetical protein